MYSKETEIISVSEASENLVNYAVNRDDLKLVLSNMPEGRGTRLVKVEYELQILKIVSTGWAISVYMENRSEKESLAEAFWNAINEFSKDLSEVTGLMIGKDIDYFQILKERLDIYVNSMNQSQEKTDTAAIIGPSFAAICGDEDDAVIILAGAKIFTTAVNAVKEYLATVRFQ